MDELLACPFCGEEAEHIHVCAYEEIVRCTNEGCFVRPSITCELPVEAFELWNKRPAPTQGADEPIERALHYPDHWDTAAYPDVYSALSEVMATFECECERTQGADARPVAIYQVEQAPGRWTNVSRETFDAWTFGKQIVYATRDAAPSDAQDAARWRELKQHTHDAEKKRGCTASEYGQANWLLNYSTMDDFMDECIKFRARAAIAPRGKT